MDKYTINRDGHPPIVFTGEKIAGADNKDHNSTRWTKVALYRTKGGKYVAKISRLTCWEGESDHITAEVFSQAADLIEWLKEGSDVLGSVSQEAVEKAAKTDANFAAAWVEEVE